MGTHIYIYIYIYIKRAKSLRVLGTGAFSLFLLLNFLAIFPIVKHTEEAEAAYTPSTSTVTITSASNIASVDITPNSAAGTFVSSATAGSEVTFGVTTDNLTGYTIAVAARSGDTSGQLTNASYGDTIDSISTTTSETDFSTGAASTYANKWGIKPSKYNSLANTSYIPAPTTSELVLDTTNSPNPTTANTYTIGLGARVDYEKAVGTYTNTYILQAVGNQISYQITYSDTTSDTSVADIPSADGANDIEVAGFTLSSTTPTRTGYTFAGWCDGTVTHVASGDSTCAPNTTTGAPGTTYAAGASYTFSSLSSSSINSATLYAMWNVKTYNVKVNFAGVGVSSVVFTATGQTTRTVSTSGGTATLTYGVPYTMTMNLSTTYEFSSWALNSASYGTLSSTSANPTTFTANVNSSSAIITATGTKIYMQSMTASECTTTPRTVYDNRDGQSYVVQRLADGKCWMMTNLNLGATTLTTNLTSSNTNLSTTVTAATFNSWKKSSGTGTYTAAELIPVSGTDPTSKTPYGTLYNYCATSAGTICTEEFVSNASYDICPKGWRLPTGGSSGEFKTLYNQSAYNTYDKMRAPYTSGGAAFALAGYFAGSGINELNVTGNYWASTNHPRYGMHYLWIKTSSSVWPDASATRSSGCSIRCVLK